MSDLFQAAQPRAPLADALRPQSLDDVAGQQHLIGDFRGLVVELLEETGHDGLGVFIGGKLKGFRRIRNDRLLMFCLRMNARDERGIEPPILGKGKQRNRRVHKRERNKKKTFRGCSAEGLDP